jgi:hypothetical protein
MAEARLCRRRIQEQGGSKGCFDCLDRIPYFRRPWEDLYQRLIQAMVVVSALLYSLVRCLSFATDVSMFEYPYGRPTIPR